VLARRAEEEEFFVETVDCLPCLVENSLLLGVGPVLNGMISNDHGTIGSVSDGMGLPVTEGLMDGEGFSSRRGGHLAKLTSFGELVRVMNLEKVVVEKC
jgi:hypothetical protein